MLLWACAKEDSEEAQPQLFIDQIRFFGLLSVDEKEISLQAGEGDYTLQTSYEQNGESLLLRGHLSNPEPGPSFAIILVHDPTNFTSVEPQYYPLRHPSNLVNLPFQHDLEASVFPPAPGKIIWNQSFFTDTLRRADLFHPEGESYTLQARHADSMNCIKSVSYTINLAEPERADLRLFTDNTGQRLATLERANAPVAEIKWYFNGQALGEAQGLALPNTSRKLNTLRADIRFVSGTELSIEKTYLQQIPQDSTCDFHLRWSSVPSQRLRPGGHGTAELRFTNKEGHVFRSMHPRSRGWLRVAGVTSSQVNEKEESVSRFNFEAQAILFNSEGDSVNLSNAHGNWAVGHP